MNIKKRKKEHLKLAKKSQHQELSTLAQLGLTYEPFIAKHPGADFNLPQQIGGKILKHPIWISSMTGGSKRSGKVNKILAKICEQYGFGMGLGSCRILLENSEYMDDFLLRPIVKDQPLWANIGISEVEELLKTKKWQKIVTLTKNLEVDGLIIHINPTQEFLQPQGSELKSTPKDILDRLFNYKELCPIMIKEVGQGFGPKSLASVKDFPLAGIEFASLGGTNFASLELSRIEGQKNKDSPLSSLTKLGHSAKDMVDFWIKQQELEPINSSWHVVISGGRGHNVLEDVSLAKKIGANHAFSIGLGYKILDLVNQSEAKCHNWVEEYLSAFYYLWRYTQLAK